MHLGIRICRSRIAETGRRKFLTDLQLGLLGSGMGSFDFFLPSMSGKRMLADELIANSAFFSLWRR